MIVSLLLACTGAPEPAAPPRVESVPAASTDRPVGTPEAWCDHYTSAEDASPFAWPPLDGPPPAATAGWTWVNAWATWCAPCVEELPRLVSWEPRLQAGAGPGALRFLSLDATADALTEFYATHPSLPMGPHIQSADAMDPWVRSVGIEPATAALPIHLLIDAQDKLRCAYMGRIEPADYGLIEALLKSL